MSGSLTHREQVLDRVRQAAISTRFAQRSSQNLTMAMAEAVKLPGPLNLSDAPALIVLMANERE